MSRKSVRRQEDEEPVFKPFRFRNIGRLSPASYIPLLYGIALLLTVYFLFVDQGRRAPQVQVRFFLLSGDASLYVDDRFYSNLNLAPGWSTSTVTLPAGLRKLRIEKAGMEPWVVEQDFRANVWNNRGNPTTYQFTVQMVQSQTVEAHHLWQEAWREYLYRGLEGQKHLSFDASHPYPKVLSDGLRALLYSKEENGESGRRIPDYWSADFQRGLASTTSIYQWGDLLSAYSLVVQSEAQGDETETRMALTGPRTLAILARTAVKRVARLEPGTRSLLDARDRVTREKIAREKAAREAEEEGEEAGEAEKTEGLSGLGAQPWLQMEEWLRNQNAGEAKGKVRAEVQVQGSGPDKSVGLPSQIEDKYGDEDEYRDGYGSGPSIGSVVLALGDIRFMAIPGRNFAVQETEVSNVQFARFWFSEFGVQWRQSRNSHRKESDAPSEAGVAKLVLYEQDHAERPWAWVEDADFAGISENVLLQDQPVRGVTWSEALAFAQWLDREQGAGKGSAWQISLPSVEERQALVETMARVRRTSGRENGREESRNFEPDFVIPPAPPGFSGQTRDALGLKGLSGVLWEWLGGDYLPFLVTASKNGSSNLEYKAVAGGSWLNVLPVKEETRDLWANEFLAEGNELPVVADYRSLAGQFTGIRSPYTGFRVLARRKTNSGQKTAGRYIK
ncbi:SUMF1/EgtB/PvdO family nonheme iron enzyme [Candidatus Haliotispira prima]|uniref:SUMF1/EgtB/PvdO family nonheme iron enzyme n=1 Tax=Candidatus Haliotispira prima TaxID=3034016 RepID=A0ABY8MEZ4_9SPIO|nr:SUMF1/EgtB/PvdO family nonheme iron enzyme [Candidatus Haliotispira prima]